MSFRTSLHEVLGSPHPSSRGYDFDAPNSAIERLPHLAQRVYTLEQILFCYLSPSSREYATVVRMDDASCHRYSHSMYVDAIEGVMTTVEAQKSADLPSGVAAGLTGHKCNFI